MSCQAITAPFLPTGKRRWSEDVCQRGVFAWAVDENGDTVPISDTPIRAMGHQGGNPCKHHVGNVSIDDRGDVLAWYCGTPIAGRFFVSPMTTTVDHRGDTVNVGYHKAPPWTEVIYYSQDRYCGAVFR